MAEGWVEFRVVEEKGREGVVQKYWARVGLGSRRSEGQWKTWVGGLRDKGWSRKVYEKWGVELVKKVNFWSFIL